MYRRLSLAALIIVLAHSPLAAQDAAPLTAEEFDAATVGRTMYYNSGSGAYGAEQYLPGRRVLWAFTGDICETGEWYPQDEFICFVYETFQSPQCWTFFAGPGGLTARFQGDAASEPLVAVQESDQPLPCTAPNLGV